MIYETLGARDAFSGTFYGVLMESYEEVDEKTFDVKLYENIVDHAGNSLKASDVVYSINKTKEIGELAEINKVDSVELVDEYTARFIWANTPALGDFESVMSGFYIVTEKAYTDSTDEMATDPVSTSPYAATGFVSGSSVVLEAAEAYWQSADKRMVPTQKADVAKITYQVITESSQLTMALQTGNIDVTANLNTDDLDQFAEGGQYADRYAIYSMPRIQSYDLCPNVSEDSPLQDINLRKAVFSAIDASTIALSISGGQANIAYTFGSNCYSDYNPEWENNYFTYDLTTAQEHLAASAYADGNVNLTIEIKSSDPVQGTIAELLQAFLGQIGVNLTIKPLSQAEFLANEPDPTQWDLRILTFSADDYITNCWAKYFDTNITGSGMTKNFIVDAKLQELIEGCTTAANHTPENIDAFQYYLVDQAYCMGLIQLYDNIIYNASLVKDIDFNQNNILAPGAFTY